LSKKEGEKTQLKLEIRELSQYFSMSNPPHHSLPMKFPRRVIKNKGKRTFYVKPKKLWKNIFLSQKRIGYGKLARIAPRSGAARSWRYPGEFPIINPLST
jgi:hypothetical protein